MFYPRLAPPATPDSKKFSRPRRRFPKSRFSQAGKASEGDPGWIRGSPGTRPRPQRPLWAPIRTDIAAPAAAESPQRHPEASRGVQIRSGAIRGDLPRRRPYGQGRRHQLRDARGHRLLRVGFCPPSAGNAAARSLPSQLRKAIPQGPSGQVCSSVIGCRALPRRRWLTCPQGLGRMVAKALEAFRTEDRSQGACGSAQGLESIVNPP